MRLDRRRFLAAALAGFHGFALRNGLAAALPAAPSGAAKRCLVLWMDGGPSQLETFDPKPGSRVGGPTRAIDTAVPGLRVASFLPEIAKRAGSLAVLRSVTSAEGDHARASQYLHTGFKPAPDFPRPALGSIVAHRRADAPQPRYVALGSRGYPAADLGLENAPFAVDEPARVVELLDRLRRRAGRIDFARALAAEFPAADSPAVAERDARVERVAALLQSKFPAALDVEREPETIRARYGADDDSFARDCLVARRLLEAGVPFVEVALSGWDTHADNHRAVADLCARLDRPWAALLDDLAASGLLDETLVVWMGEFGRTPDINADAGRDHYPDATPVVLAGAGIRGGRAIGATDPLGAPIEGRTHSVADLFATILAALGVDPDATRITDFGSPAKFHDGGRVIPDILA